MSVIFGGGGGAAGAGSAGLLSPGYVPQNWYFPFPAWQNAASTGTPVIGTTYCTPMFLAQACHVKGLGTRITTAGTTTLAFGMYANNSGASPALNRPGLLIDNTAAIVNTAISTVTGALGASHALQSGWYWLAIQLADVTMRYSAVYPYMTNIGAVLGSVNAGNLHSNSGTVTGVSFAGTYGTWPADASTQTFAELIQSTSAAPSMIFQVDTVP
jgi:hypothetical protein